MITAVILTKNEENNIIDCIESLSFCDEILVIDDNSSDRTPEIAKSKGAKVATRDLDHNFAKQRNYGLTLAKNAWVLFVDADERVSERLRHEIIRAVKSNDHDGYRILRQDALFGKVLTHGELSSKKFLRLGRQGNGKWIGAVHEKWVMDGRIGNISEVIWHFPHQTITEFLSEINFYTTIRAAELYKNGTRVSWYGIIFYTKAKFIQTYILKLGFLDGFPGFVLSMIMSFHSFLVRGKLYLLQNKK